MSILVPKVRPFLKWPGGKFRVLAHITAHLPKVPRLVEPFVGGGALFLNTRFEEYHLNDINPDLINLYTTLQKEGYAFIDYAKQYFSDQFNCASSYYALREEFNHTHCALTKAALFLYLNRHGFNGLCRYNKVQGFFNVPFGAYEKPYFPRLEMQSFHQQAARARFTCQGFEQSLRYLRSNSTVYCDPPYIPLTVTAQFTQYHRAGFSLQEQALLTDLARTLARRNITVIISNHDSDLFLKLSQGARIVRFQVRRSISCQIATRQAVKEVLAIF